MRGSILIETFDPECVIALPELDPLADNEILTPADLNDYPLAMLFRGHPVTFATQNAFAQCDATLNKRFELRTFLPALQLVGAGLCGAVVDRITAASSPAPGVVYRKFEPTITSSVALLVPAHRPASILTIAFKDHLREKLKQIEDMPLPKIDQL